MNRILVSTARSKKSALLFRGIRLFIGVVACQQFGRAAGIDPIAPHTSPTAAVIDIGVLVFREGLECILVLAAITASLVGSQRRYQRPIAVGASLGFAATLLTWMLTVRIVNDLSTALPALALQAATGLLAVIVLLVVMNWFFHRVYWTGWISIHNRRKQELLQEENSGDSSKARLLWGIGLLGFSSLYREGFEVVLFLQSYRLRLGGTTVAYGTFFGLLFASIVAVLTFWAHKRLPYRRMLVLTGALLGGVLLVMVGEQAQEMQLARWLPTTAVPLLEHIIPAWMGLWFSVFPTVETLAAQGIAAALVLGSYFVAEHRAAPARKTVSEVRSASGVQVL